MLDRVTDNGRLPLVDQVELIGQPMALAQCGLLASSHSARFSNREHGRLLPHELSLDPAQHSIGTEFLRVDRELLVFDERAFDRFLNRF